MKKRKVFLVTVVLCLLMMVGCGSSSDDEYSEFDWPDSTIANLLPVPESSVGSIDWESEDSFAVYVAKTSLEDYQEYVDACAAAGFTVDYVSGDDYYYADNADGYILDLYYEGNNVMYISIDAPSEEEESEETEETVDETDEETTETEEAVEAETTEETTETEATADGIRPEFKEAMDSYEAFFDEYCDFMKKYNNSDDTAGMLTDYTNYMVQYSETMTKLDEINDEELSDEEAAYYAEVSARISQKLLEVSQ